ncbi:MAG: class I SAM-dependent methyltransferase, partial [Acidimicrobiia bacterium]
VLHRASHSLDMTVGVAAYCTGVPRSATAGAGTAPAQPPGVNRFAQDLFTGLPARYDLLAELLSFGQNGRWRRAMVDRVVPDAPPRVLDVATGTAGVALQLARRSPGQVIGIDLTEAMLRRGQEKVASAGAGDRIHLVAGRAEGLPFPDGTFDGLTFTYLLRYVADPAATLAELARVVKPGAPVASLEFHVPPQRFWHFWWWLYTRGVLPVAGAATGGREWFEVGRFLGPSISGHYRRYPLDWTVKAWQDAGFVDIGARLMSLGGGLVMWGRKDPRESGRNG